MKSDQVAAQLYSIRDHLGTPSDIARSFAQLRAIGYRGVELAGLGPVADAELRAMLEGEGLACVSAHQPGEALFARIDEVIDKLTRLRCSTAVYPYPAGVAMATTADIEAFARKLEAAGSALAGAGIHFLYHNHNMEMKRIEGRLVLDMIFEKTHPNSLAAELDTHWIQAGGGDPVAWCRNLKGRLSILHMKDFGVADTWETLPSRVFKEVGMGNLNWREIVKAAEESGCRTFVVEQDADWIRNDPFESLRESYDFITETLCNV